MPASIVWFRQDLRLHDNAALLTAVQRGAPILPVYILDEAAEGKWRAGGASRSWLHYSLTALDGALRARGSRLVVARGDAADVLPEFIRESGADIVYWSRCYEPAIAARDEQLTRRLQSADVRVFATAGTLLFEPEQVRNRQGGPFQVFTPFWRTCLTLPVSAPVKLPPGPIPAPPPRVAKAPAGRSAGSISDLQLLPKPAWDAGFYPTWQPGEEAARQRVRDFIAGPIVPYGTDRDVPSIEGTSRLSPHLHFGEISPRQIWAAIRHQSRDTGVFPPNPGAATFLKELGWREFAYHLLVHFPQTPEQPLREAFARFPWACDPDGKRWRAWTRGQTGYPIVDAGMRQLWQTGWMHNRVRMIVASFLVKHLRLPWNRGAEFFWDTLVDADLANNTLGWQWSAGCGADAAPYFRIFAPVTQAEKFDPDGSYVRRWVPELARVPAALIHAPWESPLELEAHGVRLGREYPQPIVDHATARAEALKAFQQLKTPAGKP